MEKETIDIILLVIQAATLVALIVYVWKTWEMASATRDAAKASRDTIQEMRREAESQLRPYVVVQFEFSRANSSLDVVVRNVGATCARDVRFIFDAPLSDSRNRVLSDYSMFATGIPLLAPQAEIRTFFEMGHSVFPETRQMHTWNVSITYSSDDATRRFDEQQVLDLECLRGMTWTPQRDIGDVVRQLEKIERHLDSLSRSGKSISKEIRDSVPNGWDFAMDASGLRDPAAWRAQLQAQLRNLRLIWELYGRDEATIGMSVRHLLAAFRATSRRLLWLIAHLTDTSTTDCEAITTLAFELEGLSHSEFYIDGGRSLATFSERARQQVQMATQIEETLK